MRALSDDGVDLFATDLSNFLSCRHRTGLDMAEAQGTLKAPVFVDPIVLLLRDRGEAHEQGYVDSLKKDGLHVLDLNGLKTDEGIVRTIDAMRQGVDVIVQAVLRSSGWLGKPDVLRKVEKPSGLGNWSYEACDTKLVRETRGGTILQLALYSHLIEEAQGTLPEHFYVVTPGLGQPFTIHPYRLDDYSAYYRLVRKQLLDAVAKPSSDIQEANYPEPVPHCDVCRWFERCNARRRADDHLTFVAGISRSQRDELKTHHVDTLAQLAALPIPIPFKPVRGSIATYERVRNQAALQFHRRDTGQPVHELLLPVVSDRGLTRLPAPSRGDLFLDLEGAQFARESGREYLFGLGKVNDQGGWAYRAWWAYSDFDEKRAFEELMDEVFRAWERDPNLHVYHYAHYEPTAFKKLMGRYATREAEMDRLLRAERFVDLYAVVRHALRASVESYSIKDLEIFYSFMRKVDLKQAGPARQLLERALDANAPDLISPEIKTIVSGYNEDDCRSTLDLRDWLERLRVDLEKAGTEVPGPVPKETKAEEMSEREKRALALRERLLQGVPIEEASRTPDQQARYLLAYLVDWHRRENRVAWQEYYRLRDLPEPDLFDEAKAIAGITLVRRLGQWRSPKTGKPTSSLVDRYTYPDQEMEIKEGDKLTLSDERDLGEVAAINRVARTLEVKKTAKCRDEHPSCAFSFTFFRTDGQQDAIMDFADQVLANGFGGFDCRDSLLLRTPPALRGGAFIRTTDEPSVDFAIRVATDLANCVLPIQGPPGTGKTFTGANMIGVLAKQKLRVGVTGHSHEVIRNLLREVHEHFGDDVHLGHKPDDDELEPFIEELDNQSALQKLQDCEIDVVGGTSWLWSRPEFADSVDVLFVDEAGQMSLANVLAVARAAKSVVLLGDPQQLAQPRKGSHPEGTEVSALEHILGADQTVREGRGIFLDTTWRLPPPICTFTSETFYESRLTWLTGLEAQRLTGPTTFAGAGLWTIAVPHAGNRNFSDDEVDVVEGLMARLLSNGIGWINRDKEAAALAANDVLIIAPYNAQVARLQVRLESRGIRVGTVDKFQGQQAPVVIYSMATSRPEDAPRGMEFLYNLNRLNVATSRAQCACILVASPALFEPECRTLRQMQLANGLCRYREMARLGR